MEDCNYSTASSDNLFRFDQQSTDAVLQAGISHSGPVSNTSLSNRQVDLRTSPKMG